MRTLASLRLCDLEAFVPVFCEHRLLEGFRAVGVRALANRKVGHGLIEWLVLVQRGEARFIGNNRVLQLLILYLGRQFGDVLGCRSAATADQAQTVITDELRVCGCELAGRKRVVRAIRCQHRQTRIWHAHDWKTRELREVAKVFAHLGWAGCAVESDSVDSESTDCG